jgi:outer membrane autotransporter protein
LGNTSAIAGTLLVNGVLGGTVDVLSGGWLQGTGTVGTTNVAGGGTLASGAPFGTLTVAGNISFAPGSALEVKTDPAGVVTLLHATGSAIIGGGTVNVITQGSLFRIGARYTILTADGGRVGQFNAINEITGPLVDMRLGYDSNNVYLDIARNSATLCSFAVTQNQCATSTTEASLGLNNPVVVAVLGLPDLPSIQAALDLLSGEIHASAKGAALENSRFLRDAVTDRVRQSFDTIRTSSRRAPERTAWEDVATGRAVWAKSFGSWGRGTGNGNAASTTGRAGGIFVGSDMIIAETFRAGIATGYSNSSLTAATRYSSVSSDDYHVALYGGGQWSALGLRFGAAHTWHNVRANRNIIFPGFADSASATYGARTTQVFGEAGYALSNDGLIFEPFARLASVNLETGGYVERGGPAALQGLSSTNAVTFSTFGLHATKALQLSSGVNVAARGTVGWRHAYGSITPITTNAFASSTSFMITGLPIAPNAIVVNAGLDINVTNSVTLGISYDGQFARAATDSGLRADLTWRF